MYDTYFKNSNGKGGTVYETELGNKIYYSELQKNSTLNILSRNKMMDEWGKGNMLPGRDVYKRQYFTGLIQETSS